MQAGGFPLRLKLVIVPVDMWIAFFELMSHDEGASRRIQGEEPVQIDIEDLIHGETQAKKEANAAREGEQKSKGAQKPSVQGEDG